MGGGVGLAGLQKSEDLGLAGEGGEIGGRRAALVGHGIRAGVKEQGGDLDVALEGHATEGRLALIVAEVDRGARLQQQLHDLGSSMVTGQHQQRVALGILRVSGQTVLD